MENLLPSRNKMRHESAYHLLMYYVTMYYFLTEKTPELRTHEAKHLELIEQIDVRYVKGMGRNNFKAKVGFVHTIDFLTQVYTVKRQREALQKDKQDAREKFLGASAGSRV